MLYYTYAMVGFVVTFMLGVGIVIRKKAENYKDEDGKLERFMQYY